MTATKCHRFAPAAPPGASGCLGQFQGRESPAGPGHPSFAGALLPNTARRFFGPPKKSCGAPEEERAAGG